MDSEGTLYLVVEDCDKADKWGQIVTDRGKSVETLEAPPKVQSLARFRVVNSLHVRHVPTDEPKIALYYRDDEEGARFFYQKSSPLTSLLMTRKLSMSFSGRN